MSKQQRAQFEDLKEKKRVVEISELNSRYFKAEWETMYYALEREKIRPAYEEFIAKNHPEVLETERLSEQPATSGFSQVKETELGETTLITSEDADTEK